MINTRMNNLIETSADPVVILGIDHGFGNIKTAHACFRAGVTACDHEPTFRSNLLVHQGRCYIIGEEHKEFTPDKMRDDDYYLLTLSAIGRELRIRGLTSARVVLGVGLPLTWVGEQKEAFRSYLLRDGMVDFMFRDVEYHVELLDAYVFPQGFSGVATQLRAFKGANMLCDIGNGTMNIMHIASGHPLPNKCYTEKYGTNQCMLAAREVLLQKTGTPVDEFIIEDVLRRGTSDISPCYLDIIRETAVSYTKGIMRRLREREYNPELMRLYVMGGGSCLIRNLAEYDPARVTINDDICATAKGYELLAGRKWKNGGKGGMV